MPDFKRGITVFDEKGTLQPFEEAKLYGHNAAHALMGYLAQELFVLLTAQLLHAASFGCFHSAAVHFVQRAFGIRHLGRGQASYATVSGMGGALGALYAGYSWSALGAGPTFLIASTGAALAAFIIAKRLKETPHSAPPV